ncbi:dirigent protein 21-like [Prunus avium]|uniref:Dirigent protein n=1 Tax=Prunus avium TaxID=42229 RepID=A0A6P5SEN2_PRUAV|nr:dirigent protein 21-like [Prunus avium]
MAKTLQNLNSIYTIFITIFLFFFFFFFFLTLANAEAHRFSKPLSPSKHGLKKEKLSHLHFYFHDIVSGRNPTAVRVAEAPTTNTSLTGFGAVVMMDEPLTVGPELGSKLVGKAQGIYASASQSEVGFLNRFFAYIKQRSFFEC